MARIDPTRAWILVGVAAAVGVGVAVVVSQKKAAAAPKAPVLTGGLKTPALANVRLVDANPINTTAPAGGILTFHPADGSPIQSIVATLQIPGIAILPVAVPVPLPNPYASLAVQVGPAVYTVVWGPAGKTTTTVVTITPV